MNEQIIQEGLTNGLVACSESIINRITNDIVLEAVNYGGIDQSNANFVRSVVTEAVVAVMEAGYMTPDEVDVPNQEEATQENAPVATEANQEQQQLVQESEDFATRVLNNLNFR